MRILTKPNWISKQRAWMIAIQLFTIQFTLIDVKFGPTFALNIHFPFPLFCTNGTLRAFMWFDEAFTLNFSPSPDLTIHVVHYFSIGYKSWGPFCTILLKKKKKKPSLWYVFIIADWQENEVIKFETHLIFHRRLPWLLRLMNMFRLGYTLRGALRIYPPMPIQQ